MSKTSEFWEYAKEAVLAAAAAKTDNERQSLIDLARTWTQAALQEQLCTSFEHPQFAKRERNSPCRSPCFALKPARSVTSQ